MAGDDIENCKNSQLTLTNLSHHCNTLEIITDSDICPPSASSTKNYDTLYSSSREEMEVASMVQPYEGEPRALKWLYIVFDKALDITYV